MMNKVERTKRLKDIIETLNKDIAFIEGNCSSVIKEAEEKVQDLSWFLEQNCIMPTSFDEDKIMEEILIEYFEQDDDMVEIGMSLNEFINDVQFHIDEMDDENDDEDENVYEWEDFCSKLGYAEDMISISENNITTIEQFIESLKDLRNYLQDLI